MEIKTLAAIIFALSFFSMGYAYNCTVPSQCRPNPCADTISSCECTDPACRSDSPCLSRARCCHYFGNVGADSIPNDY